MNTDYLVRITTKHGRRYRYQKEDSGWTQTSPTGTVRRLSAEQLLSDLLPPLAAHQPHLSVRIERKPAKVRSSHKAVDIRDLFGKYRIKNGQAVKNETA